MISFVGWMFESLSTVDSLNYSNLICFVIFLPIFIYNDQYTNVRKQEKGVHSKDLLILSVKNDEQMEQSNRSSEEQTDIIFGAET